MRLQLWKTGLWSVILAAGFTLAGLVTAEEWARYDAQPGSKLKIEGTSTIHDWSVEGQIIGGRMELPADFTVDPAQASSGKVNELPRVQAIIPVRSMKSGNPLMDNVMHGAMKEAEHPRIFYQVTEMTRNAPTTPGGPAQFEAKGQLAVAGVTNSVSMPVTIEPAGENKLKVTGAAAVKMTDFGIQPPAPKIALGAIKTSDDVKITFEWLTARKP